MKTYTRLVQILLVGWLCFAGCKQVDPVPLSLPTETVEVQPSPEPSPTPGLDPQESARLTLATLQKVGDYPLYTMQYYGDYEEVNTGVEAKLPGGASAWGCSLFAALGDAQSSLFGRNFDWTYSPAMLLQYHPTGGYASITMVDLAYLVDEVDYDRLTELTYEQLEALLYAPSIPFDGMNETGLAIGMAAVPTGYVPADPEKETISSLGVMREVLDHAATVEEAVAIIRSYNIDFSGGPDLHYLIADKTGASALVEFSDGEVVVIENEQPWHMMTNFIVDQHRENPEGQCVRYRAISDKLEEQSGVLTVEDALKLLWQVSQSGSTQWSVVYDLSRVEVNVVMGMEYEEVFRYPVINP